MSFIHDDFLLTNEPARRLYHEVAKDLPIIDYHTHLPPQDVANNRTFSNLFEIWLEGDHYKWRAMRTNAVSERFCTGDAEPYEKFVAYAKTLPMALRNPLYHWSHLEMKRYFDIDLLINEQNAAAIWEQANEKLKAPERNAIGILTDFNVEIVCSTDDPADSLSHHEQIAQDDRVKTRILPTFRPDKALRVDQPMAFNAWCDRLAAAADVDCSTFEGLLSALRKRHDDFHAIGCRLSDHGLETVLAEFCNEEEAARIFKETREGVAADPKETRQYGSFLMLYFGLLDKEKGWTKQLHLGAMRNNNSEAFAKLGPDTGFDSIGDFPQARALSDYLDRLHSENALPKVILYNLNPVDNYAFATMLGNFMDGEIAGKIQHGSGWWFNDNLDGMTAQINAVSNCSLLSRFVGMLTDSRSFLSYPRHEYFRRLFCQIIGKDIEGGLIPDEWEMTSDLVHRVCYQNAKDFLALS